jgi:hypothetical protein
MDLNRCKEFDKGIQEYYTQRCEQFADLEGAGLYGLYMPFTEDWSWALIKLFDSMGRYTNVGLEYQRTYKRIPEITIGIERVYEKYEP